MIEPFDLNELIIECEKLEGKDKENGFYRFIYTLAKEIKSIKERQKLENEMDQIK